MIQNTGRLTLGLSLLLVLSVPVCAQTPDVQPRVATIECPAGDDNESVKPRAGESMPVPADLHLIDQLAYYKSEHGPGVLAPKGWDCRAGANSNGSFLVVTPKHLAPPYSPLPTIVGPAVTINSWDGSGSGRFHVAIVAARLFKVVGSEFITRVRQEHLISDSSFDATPYPNDDLKYLSDRLVQYTTQANHTGLGTDDMFEASPLPVRGLIVMNLEGELSSITEVRIRLPAAQNSVGEAILQLETACVQFQQGCRSLQ